MLLLPLLLLLCIPAGVLSRRGFSVSSGDSDSDSDNDSHDYGDSSSTSYSSSGSACIDDYFLRVDDLQPAHYTNYTFVYGDTDAYTDWNGVYLQGESFFQYEIRHLPTNYTYHGTNCPTGTYSIRMLGVAWVGPRAPTPKGLRNPFTLGFKAWQSDKDVSEIAYSYSFCDTNVDLVHLVTTVDWREYSSDSNAVVEGAIDAVVLNITKAADNNQKIRFAGVYDLTSLTEWQMVSSDGIHYDQIHLPAQTCNLGDVLIGMPTGTHVSGSMTNDTLKLDISGSSIAGFRETYGTTNAAVNVSFRISFEGSYDAANSSQVLKLGQSGQPLVTFDKATGAASAPATPLFLMAFCLTTVCGIALL